MTEQRTGQELEKPLPPAGNAPTGKPIPVVSPEQFRATTQQPTTPQRPPAAKPATTSSASVPPQVSSAPAQTPIAAPTPVQNAAPGVTPRPAAPASSTQSPAPAAGVRQPAPVTQNAPYQAHPGTQPPTSKPAASQSVTQQNAAQLAPDKEARVARVEANIPLGERLIAKGLISRDQLETALKEQGKQGAKKKMLGTLLVDMGFITESALGEVLTESSGVKKFDFKKAALDPALIRKIPREVAMRYKAIPVSVESGTVYVALTDVYNILAIDQIRKFFPSNLKIIPVYGTEGDILEVIDHYYGYEMTIDGILREIETGVSERGGVKGDVEGYVNPTVRLVDAILVDAIKRGASDIHLEPEGSFVRLRYRVDGLLVQVRSFHKEYWPAIVVRVKIVAGMNIAESRNPQDGRATYYVSGHEVDFRVATHPTVHGENIVLRILDKRKALVPMNRLGFSEHNEKLLKKLLKRPEGIIIVTGPTGSGKTTTMYSILNYINSVSINIMTLENPVEYQLPMIRQADIKEESGMDFISGIKSLMRQDPDVIFVGEVRDEETAMMAMRAAMTGHRVFTTLHTNDALGAIPRLINIGIPPHLLAGSLVCTMAQRLIRKLCEKCKEAVPANPSECQILGVDPNNPPAIYAHRGCVSCNSTGYSGRVAVNEILAVDREMDELIATSATRKVMLEYALKAGFVTMLQDGINKVLAGVTDVDELVRAIDLTERL